MNQPVERIRMALKYATNVGASAVPINPYVLAAVLTHIDDQAAEIDRIKAQQERKPDAWARKWHIDGEKPAKVKKENGRWAWPGKFKFLPVTAGQCMADDVALYLDAQQERKPMPESEANAICEKHGTYWLRILRATEAFHGIKETP